MKQCWDADPSKRPDINTLRKKIRELNLFYQSKSNESLTQPEENNNFEMENYTNSSKLFTSKLHQFDNLPEPRNATEEEQEVDDFNKLSSKKNSISKISSIFKDIQNDYKIEAMQRQTMNHHIKVNDEDEAHNNPNLHSEEQDELELPDSKNLFLNVKFY
ncbi:hypothetical protein RhiirA1_542263 [Rhizophagus irregularis]|uniref:Serine-threonine/tyrosine-protein kinase catalytic domain-containing protein n=1 Tax=Rhizophagus irregularis TaxID=588596 RepID=A0A2N0QYB1_9GLOM|nr:hypothetical protein RhiirA1_542263 [Rhizophagus irregularis]